MRSAIWVNGERHAPDGVHVSGRDRGFTLADGLFETMRVRAGLVFRLERHLVRLEQSLATLQIPVPPRLRDWVLAAIPPPGDGDASVRLTVTRGGGPPGLAPPAAVQPTVVIAVSPLPVFPASLYEIGLTAHVASGRRNEHAATAGLKTLAYTDAVVALLEARRAGAEEALFLDTGSHCSEATASNLFIVAGGGLVTPPIACAALPGITRAAVLELARRFQIPAAERPFGLDELFGASEAFLTSSIRGIVPLVCVDGRAIGAGGPGEVTRRVSEAYAALVAAECGVREP